MSGGLRIPGPQLSAPVVQGPRIERQDVSSGLMAVADAQQTIAAAQDARMLNDAQIGAAKAFRDHDEELRKLPWDQKVAKFEENAKEIRATYFDSMPGYLKQQASADFERMYGSYQVHTRDDAYKGERDHALSTVAEGSKDYERAALTARTPEELRLAKETLASSWKRLADGGYISTDEARAGTEQAFGSGDLIRAQKLIQTNPWEAKKALGDPAKAFPYLDPKHVPSLMNQADGEARSREAQARADADHRRAEAAGDAEVLIKSDLEGRQNLGQGVSVQDQERIRAAMTPKQWGHYQAAAARSDAIFKMTGDLRTKSNVEIQNVIAAAKPKLNADGSVPSDFANQQDAYEAAKAIANQEKTRRATDPALAVREAFPRVALAWEQYAQNPTADGHLRVAIKRTLAAQDALGIPADKQKPLTATLAQAFAGDIRSAPADQAAKKLAETAQFFGENWPKVYAQLAPHLDSSSAVAATLSPNMAAVLLETSRTAGANGKPGGGVTALRSSLGVDATGAKSITDIIANDDDFKDFRRAMAPRTNGGSIGVSWADNTEKLALGLMSREGIGFQEAAQKAIKETVTNKYNFGRVNGVPFVTPKSVDAGQAEQGARALLETLKEDSIDLPWADAGAIEKDTRDQYVSNVKRGAYWVTLPGNKGLELWAGDVPVTRNGQRLQYTWDVLQGRAPDLSAAGKEQANRDRYKTIFKKVGQ